jgi:hypothetical protein
MQGVHSTLLLLLIEMSRPSVWVTTYLTCTNDEHIIIQGWAQLYLLVLLNSMMLANHDQYARD